jgi:hypothetical protein
MARPTLVDAANGRAEDDASEDEAPIVARDFANPLEAAAHEAFSYTPANDEGDDSEDEMQWEAVGEPEDGPPLRKRDDDQPIEIILERAPSTSKQLKTGAAAKCAYVSRSSRRSLTRSQPPTTSNARRASRTARPP